jgi:hypothetical protein
MAKLRFRVNGKDVGDQDLSKQPGLAVFRDIRNRAERALRDMQCDAHSGEVTLDVKSGKEGGGLTMKACCRDFEGRVGRVLQSALG